MTNETNFKETAVPYQDLNMIFFVHLRYWDDQGEEVELEYNDYTKEHIQLRFGHRISNYSNDVAHEVSYFDAVQCGADNFEYKIDPDSFDEEL